MMITRALFPGPKSGIEKTYIPREEKVKNFYDTFSQQLRIKLLVEQLLHTGKFVEKPSRAAQAFKVLFNLAGAAVPLAFLVNHLMDVGLELEAGKLALEGIKDGVKLGHKFTEAIEGLKKEKLLGQTSSAFIHAVACKITMSYRYLINQLSEDKGEELAHTFAERAIEILIKSAEKKNVPDLAFVEQKILEEIAPDPQVLINRIIDDYVTNAENPDRLMCAAISRGLISEHTWPVPLMAYFVHVTKEAADGNYEDLLKELQYARFSPKVRFMDLHPYLSLQHPLIRPLVSGNRNNKKITNWLFEDSLSLPSRVSAFLKAKFFPKKEIVLIEDLIVKLSQAMMWGMILSKDADKIYWEKSIKSLARPEELNIFFEQICGQLQKLNREVSELREENFQLKRQLWELSLRVCALEQRQEQQSLPSTKAHQTPEPLPSPAPEVSDPSPQAQTASSDNMVFTAFDKEFERALSSAKKENIKTALMDHLPKSSCFAEVVGMVLKVIPEGEDNPFSIPLGYKLLNNHFTSAELINIGRYLYVHFEREYSGASIELRKKMAKVLGEITGRLSQYRDILRSFCSRRGLINENLLRGPERQREDWENDIARSLVRPVPFFI